VKYLEVLRELLFLVVGSTDTTVQFSKPSWNISEENNQSLLGTDVSS
jgi:hypothetical protein